ncbi:DNA repair and recombination protein RadA [Nanoarchaeota archaeon]
MEQILETKTVKKNIKTEKDTPKTMTKKEIKVSDLAGVGAATAEKLEASGYLDLMSIGMATPSELVEATGMGDGIAKRIIAQARSSLDMGFESGEDLMKKRENIIKIPTGSKAFDDLLGGGFESGGITEVFSAYGSGKTQIGHTLAVNALKTFPDSYVVYIDTESTFRPERIKQIAEGAGLDPQEALKRIKVARAFNSDHQSLLSEKVEDLIKKEGLDVKLVVVDSLTAHFRAEFIGRGTLADRQQKLNRHMHTLAKLSDANNMCVYVTNQVMAKPDTFFGDPTEAIGGHIVGHNSQTRIYLRKGKKGTRVVKLIDSPHLEDGEATIQIVKEGVRDV